LLLPLSTAGTAAGHNDPAEAEPLAAEEKQLLDGLFEQLLFDPKGAQRVRVKIAMRTAWGGSEQVEREGWLRAGTGGQPDRVYFTDGENIVAPESLTKIDFISACRARWAPKKEPKAKAGQDKIELLFADRDTSFAQMKRGALGITDDSDLVLAAWL